MSKKNMKSTAATVAVTVDDLKAMRHSSLGLTPVEAKKAAKTRASGRELFIECGSGEITLAAMVSGLPRPMVEKFCRSYLKAA